jgi:hypothetical protein
MLGRFSLLSCALALSVSCGHLAHAASAPAGPGWLPVSFPPGGAVSADHWYVASHLATASTLVAGVADFQSMGGIASSDVNLAVSNAQVNGARSASAAARVDGASLGGASAARDALDSTSTLTVASSWSQVWFMGFMKGSGPLTFTLHLDGSLLSSGDRSPVSSDPSGASVGLMAMGSLGPGADTAAYAALASVAGVDPSLEGEALLRRMLALPTTTQAQMITFGQQATTVNRSVLVDQNFEVTALGTPQECSAYAPELCGTSFYFLAVTLVTGAENGGAADFMHSLKVTDYRDGAGAVHTFAAQPVPEPATIALWLVGLAATAGVVRRRLR